MNLAPDVDTSTLESLDFSADLPCEAEHHARSLHCLGRALWVQTNQLCDPESILVCDNKRLSHKKWMGYRCDVCGEHHGFDTLHYAPIPEVWSAR